jgi:hypothetical protein
VAWTKLKFPEESLFMTDLEKDLTKVLDEHRHESGLHVIGGERRLLNRLIEFFEHGARLEDSKESRDLDN